MEKSLNSSLAILYVEDDSIARENGVEYLENYFHNIYEAPDAISALKLYEKHKPDIIITDIQMPKLNGLEFIKKIRHKDKKTQVIIITAFSDTKYLLEAIELKLIKYLIKPVKEKDFDDALNLCVQSIHEESSNIVDLSSSTYFDIYNQTLVRDEQIVKLRTKELELFTLLLKNKNRYVTYNEIENLIWQDSVMTKDALKTLIKNLKFKLPKDLISNLTGTGYKLAL
ncbi:MAG: two-component system response regulator VanR [Sulfurimonas sp.]|jgi:two-component system response regulator VanR|uniref:response regulator transcription factor n=1 Tax=Sulfurimonas sp. TaxID=2022749 RepID=UPI0039E4BB6A